MSGTSTEASTTPARNTGTATSPQIDRVVFVATFIGGLVMILVVGFSPPGFDPKWGKWIMATGIALVTGSISSVAVSQKLPATGQYLTLGGSFAAVFVLLVWVSDPNATPRHGTIQTLPNVVDVVLNAGLTPIYTRRGDGSVEFLINPDEVEAPFWQISLSMGEGKDRRPLYIKCLPRDLLRDLSKARTAATFILEPIPANTAADQVYKLRPADRSELYGTPEPLAVCGSKSSVGAAAAAAASIVPSAPARTDQQITPQVVAEATRDLRAANLDQRLAATATIADAVNSNADSVTQTVLSWKVDKSEYDDDLGRLLAWLKPLRRVPDNPAQGKKILDSLSAEQAAYLVALMVTQDRSLRLAARETVGWLLQAGSGPSLGKLLQPIMHDLRAPSPWLPPMEEKFGQPPRSRRFTVYNLLDVQLDAWCGYTDAQRQIMLQSAAQANPADIGPDATSKLADLKTRRCSA